MTTFLAIALLASCSPGNRETGTAYASTLRTIKPRLHVEVDVYTGLSALERSSGWSFPTRTLKLESVFHIRHRGRHLSSSIPSMVRGPRDLDLVDRGDASDHSVESLDPDIDASALNAALRLATCENDRTFAFRLAAAALPAQPWRVLRIPDDSRARAPGTVRMEFVLCERARCDCARVMGADGVRGESPRE